MKKFFISFLVILAGIAPLTAQDDSEGCKDPALFTRLPNFHIYRCEDLQFDKFDFRLSSDKTISIEGHHILIHYYLNENAQAPGGIQIIRNYTNAIKKIGGQIVYEFEDGGIEYSIMKLVKNAQEVWVQVNGGGNGMYSINIVEKQAMDQDVIADASSMASSIKEAGKVALYGIYFDTGKSSLKPESQPALEEISKLLKADPGLKLYVVGHTDNTGLFNTNIKLSMDRATVVVGALVTQFAVNPARLTAYGDGPTSPVASNDKEEGRALNRRVELVKQ
ncbi:MAG TPA: OmpA family protein, partial [Bacteroidales bacterium]|nr:OmpA family protein [Bacteroidales bacterium]